MTGALPVLTRREGHVLVVTLNRPAVHNAVDRHVAELLATAVEQAGDDQEIWVLVLTGAGERAFCAGADLKALTDDGPIVAPGHPEWGFAGFVRHFTPVPVIAAVEGWALGGGMEICLACDLVVAARGARFRLPELRRGIIPGGGALVRLPSRIPRAKALELIYLGTQLSAAEALALGLVNEVVEDGTALERALSLAARVCEAAPLAVRAAKRVVWGQNGGEGGPDDARWRHADAERLAIGRTADAREGVAAFVEKRPPEWRGR